MIRVFILNVLPDMPAIKTLQYKDKENGYTRESVQAALDARTASISARLEAIENEMPMKPSTIRRLSRHKKLIRNGLIAGAAVLLLRSAVRRFRNADESYDEGIRRIASSISKEVVRNLRAGMPERDAVDAALRKRPPVLRFGGRSDRDHAQGALKVLLKQLAVTLSPVVIETVVDLIRHQQRGVEGEKNPEKG